MRKCCSWEPEGRSPSGPLRWEKTVLRREIPTSVVRSRYGGGRVIFCEKMLLEGAGGPVSLRTSSPVRSLSRVDTDPHAALRALLVGLRPPTPQSPERLRSTPFDCVAIAPCCFAFRKAVLSHALAALTALNKSASQVEREAIAAMNALLTQTVANVILRTKQPFPPRQKPRHGCGRRSG